MLLSVFSVVCFAMLVLSEELISTSKFNLSKRRLSVVSAYHFPPLQPGYIRLLRQIPYPDQHAPLRCQLFDRNCSSTAAFRVGCMPSSTCFVWLFSFVVSVVVVCL